MLMRVMMQHTQKRDPVEQGRALFKYVIVDATGGDDAAAKAAEPGWLIRGVENAPADAKLPAKRAPKA